MTSPIELIEAYEILRRQSVVVSDDPETDKVLRSRLGEQVGGLLGQAEENGDITRWAQGLIASLVVNRRGMGRTTVEEIARDAGLNGKTIYERSIMVQFYGRDWAEETVRDLLVGQSTGIWFTIYRNAYRRYHKDVRDKHGVDLGLQDALQALEQCVGLSVGAAEAVMSGKAATTRKQLFQTKAKVVSVNRNTGMTMLCIGDAIGSLQAGDEIELKAWKNVITETKDKP